MIVCPRCSPRHKPSVETCDCGYDLTAVRRHRQALDSDAAMRGSAHRWLRIWRRVIKWGALVELAGGGWFALVLSMDEQPLTALFVAALTGLSLITSVAASKGIALLLYLDQRQSVMVSELAELRRQRP